jgi:hypothetical protein
MNTCHFCEKPINSIPYKCKFCDNILCGEHRLPEAHKCPNINTNGKWFIKHENPERKISDLERDNVKLQDILLGFTKSTMSRNEARILFDKNVALINKLKDRKDRLYSSMGA